jgi:adenosylcobyric acid synthase
MEGKMARALMVQGCTSNAGKSYLVAGLCRLFANRGVRVAPFKAQNMSNNAGVTPDGREMGRAQLLQAQAANVTPEVRMNPVLLKPEADTRSQVVLLGKARHDLREVPWLERGALLWDSVRASLHSLMVDFDLVLIEGAGSPAEVNLQATDIVNMRVAKEVAAKVLLAADIDRGGAFAHLLGTWHCFDSEERRLLAGFILNKFRGDPTLLGNGMNWLEQQTGVPTVGIVPMLRLPLPEEDAFSLPPQTLDRKKALIAIVQTPHISNFDEFDALIHEPALSTHFVRDASMLNEASAIILPGSKHVAADLAFLRASGIATELQRLAKCGKPILGICGGLQMLGQVVRDPYDIEGGGTVPGLGLLELETDLAKDKITRQVTTTLCALGETVTGYEIHHGRTRAGAGLATLLGDGLGYVDGTVMGVYVHGLFDNDTFRHWFLAGIGANASIEDWQNQVDTALDTLAEHLETSLDMAAIDRALEPATTGQTLKERGLFLITGGTRSGKSRYAEALALHFGKQEVTVIATLEPNDEEMRERIARHQEERPAGWQTIEAPLAVREALGEADTPVVVIDCLSGFVSNLLLERTQEGEEAALKHILEAIKSLLEAIRLSGKTLIIVSNEVGSGIVPAYALGRWYRDALGLSNRLVARAADGVSLLTVGIPRTLKGRIPEVDVDA